MTYKHLSRDERSQIQALKARGISDTRISLQLGRSQSTISRELRRNSSDSSAPYDGILAHQQALERKANNAKKIPESQWKLVIAKLHEYWSPEQIHGYFSKSKISIPCSESIYKKIYQNARVGGKEHKCLRQRHRQRRSYKLKQRRKPKIHGRIGIEDRPLSVLNKSRYGHWEGDTIICEQGGKALVTLVERKSGYVLIELISKKSASSVAEAIIRSSKRSGFCMKSLTLDNGSEFVEHKIISESLNVKIYFSRPYTPTDRAINENTNGLIRQYFPKGARKNKGLPITPRSVSKVERALNARPRMRLNYSSPNDMILCYK